MSKRTPDIIICILWWLTLSIVFPFQAKKRGVVNRRWVRIMLTLISPAALLTYLITAVFIISAIESRFNEKHLPLKTKEEFAMLTEIKDFPDFKFKGCYRYLVENTVHAEYSFLEEAPTSFISQISYRCYTQDLYWKRVTSDSGVDSFIYHRGWSGRYMKKPYESIQDNITIKMRINSAGFSVDYELFHPYRFKGYSTPKELTDCTGVSFPPFEIVNYEWHPYGPDDVATMTLQLKNKPSRAFINQLKKKWGAQSTGEYTWGDWEEVWEDGAPRRGRHISVNENSRIVYMDYSSY